MLEKKHSWKIGLSVAAISLVMLLVGVHIILGNQLNMKNIFAFIGLSLLLGVLALMLIYFSYKLTFGFFMLGLAIGFFEMYRIFWNGMSGWGDLIGILSLFMWVIIGLGSGILAQLGYYIYNKKR